MRVDIYRNLNRAKQRLPEQWSIRHKGLVIGYTAAAILENATTYVIPGAVDTIRASGRKQVCAWFTGEWTPTRILRTERHRKKDFPIYAAPDGVDYTGHASPVTFNPRHQDHVIAQAFHYTSTWAPIAPKRDSFKYVYFLDNHTAAVWNANMGGGLGRSSC